ncbi:hypothetical protein BTH42_11940 [Burkholderia sp. SRS-W-2-2016]|nr:hypothetical protein BTH42_11940 [Burkholderia sp. SRS-W-2-2016]
METCDEMIHDGLKRAGLAQPRIAVCGFNPHNGDNGESAREEIDVIAPVVEADAGATQKAFDIVTKMAQQRVN